MVNKECQKCLEDRNRLYLEYLKTYNELLGVQKMVEKERLLQETEKRINEIMKPTLGIKRLTETSILPNYQTKGAAGFDLHASHNITIPAGGFALVKTGLAFEIPEQFEVQIRSRSGLALKNGIQAHFGTVDSDYKNEIGVILYNHSSIAFEVKEGDRIAQGILSPVVQSFIVEVHELSESERKGGFGSTGV